MRKRILLIALFTGWCQLSFAQLQPINTSRVNISDATDNVVTSTSEGMFHHLIGTYAGWDKGTIYIGGYNAGVNMAYATQRVCLGSNALSSNFVMVDLMNGSMGIGTYPSSKLDVMGTINVGNKHGDILTVNNANPTWGSKTILRTGWNENTGDWTELRVAGGAINSAALRLTYTGNVGIGTTAPSDKLEISNGVLKVGYASFGNNNLASPKNAINFGSDNHGSIVIGANIYVETESNGSSTL